MKPHYAFLFLLISILSANAQSPGENKRAPTVYYRLVDSTIVSGKLVRQDSVSVVLRLRSGELTYLAPDQIVSEITKPNDRATDRLTTYVLKDSAVVTGQIIKQTPVAVVVRQQDGTQT